MVAWGLDEDEVVRDSRILVWVARCLRRFKWGS